MKIRFKKGKQKEFLDNCISKLNSPSLVGLLDYGISTSYSSLKNYYSERRLISSVLFNELTHLTQIPLKDLDFIILEDNWGKSKGGKISKRKTIN